MSTVLVDSGFLIALYDDSDTYHLQAKDYFAGYLEPRPNQLLVPWPILYETISTRMTRNPLRISAIESDWKLLRSQDRLVLLDDREFRSGALEECLEETKRSQRQYRPLSLTDRVIRRMLSEMNLRIDVFITFNPRDFMDVCIRFRRNLASSGLMG